MEQCNGRRNPCFMIARIAGRDVVEKLTTKFAMDSIEQYFERYGKHTILICRLLPFVSFDFVSYAAGLTSMSLAAFFDSNRNWTTSGNNCIFLRWRDADRKCKDGSHSVIINFLHCRHL